MKQFLIRLKNNLKQLVGYPTCAYGPDFGVDYEIYWTKRRSGDIAVLSDWQRQRADLALRFIKVPASVIDLGCGDGGVLNYLRGKSAIDGIGVDVDSRALAQASALGLKTHQADINNPATLSGLPEADYALAFEILEHLPLPETLLYHLYKKVRRGIIFSLPNTGYCAHRFRLLLGRFPLQWVAHPGEHLRFWTISDMRFWLRSLGFNNFQIIPYEGWPVLKKIWPSLFAAGLLVVIKK